MTDTATALPIALSSATAPTLAAAFTGGCVALHALRRHADRITGVLATTVLVLGALLALVAASERPSPAAPDASDPPACYGFD